MGLKTSIVGTKGVDATISEAHVRDFEAGGNRNHHGLVTLTHPYLQYEPQLIPFVNAVNGVDMAINAGFSGVPAFIYESGSSSDAANGTASSTSSGNLVDNSQGGGNDFDTTVSVGMVVRNTTDTTYAHVTAVTNSTTLALDNDIMESGESYTVGAEWPGTAIAGAWNFATDISISNANNNDEAVLTNPHTSVMSNYAAITGKITLTTWNSVQNNLIIKASLAGLQIGDSINLNDFIDTGLLGTQQTFIIPKASLGLGTQVIDEINICIERVGGVRPTIDLDDIQLEKTSGSVTYSLTVGRDTRFNVQEISFSLADAMTGAVTNGTMPGLSYDSFLGVPSLTNGIILQLTQNGKVTFAIPLKQMSDLLSTGSTLTNAISDGTNTFITLGAEFKDPTVLEGCLGDTISLTINDDLSGLLLFTAAVRGSAVTES